MISIGRFVGVINVKNTDTCRICAEQLSHHVASARSHTKPKIVVLMRENVLIVVALMKRATE